MSTIRFPHPPDDEYDELINQLDEIPDPPTQRIDSRNRRRLLLGTSALIASAALGIVAYRRRLRPKHYFPLSNHLKCELSKAEGLPHGEVNFVDGVINVPSRGKVTFPTVKFTKDWSLLFWARFTIIRRVFDSKKEEAEYEKHKGHTQFRPFLSSNGWGVFFKRDTVILEATNLPPKPVTVKSRKWTLCHFRVPPTIGEIALSQSKISDITIWDRVLTEGELSKLQLMSRDEYRSWVSG